MRMVVASLAVMSAFFLATEFAEARYFVQMGDDNFHPYVTGASNSDQFAGNPIARSRVSDGGYVDGYNLYQYVGSSPLFYTDPTGESGYCSDDCKQRPVPGFPGIVYYGCYCGKDNQPGPGGGLPKPIDPVDGACSDHDSCYGTNGCTYGDQNPSPACAKCDSDFCRKLKMATCNRYGAGTPEFRDCESYKRAAMVLFKCKDRFGIRPPGFSY